MDQEGFRDFCTKRSLHKEVTQAHIKMVKEFEAFLKKKGKNKYLSNATAPDLQSFVAHLMKNKKNTWENFLALLRYSRFSNNRKVEVALLELMDGSEVLQNLSDAVRRTVGETKRDAIFKGIELPPLGTHSKDKPKITKKVMERLEAEFDEKACREILSSGLHGPIPKKVFLPERKKFRKSKSIDDFLEKRHKEFVDELEKHRREKTLFFTQEIDEEVVEYVRKTPTCQNGVREGDTIYVTKIPYMVKKYLHEKDEKKKRYYYCHCPWVREAIKSDLKISSNFCYCSAGFEKRPWDVIFDQSVKADVIKTVLKGDLICKFAIHIPKEFLKSQGTAPREKDEIKTEEDVIRFLSDKTEFERNVLVGAFKIPKGKVSTYKRIAEKIGRPRAYRAVASALRKNPLHPVVPCHRVVRSDGGFGGEKKAAESRRKQVEKEGVPIKNCRVKMSDATLF
ncbi:MAG: MGMT family protein [Candidatus Bathyarchaeota archaeon]|nr:MGMT family protein [Candidatus Bathyarchaeota archaeon]MDH5787909.1 MGMT family protein [Candidatus Bathyarchaeota archaeon]